MRKYTNNAARHKVAMQTRWEDYIAELFCKKGTLVKFTPMVKAKMHDDDVVPEQIYRKIIVSKSH